MRSLPKGLQYLSDFRKRLSKDKEFKSRKKKDLLGLQSSQAQDDVKPCVTPLKRLHTTRKAATFDFDPDRTKSARSILDLFPDSFLWSGPKSVRHKTVKHNALLESPARNVSQTADESGSASRDILKEHGQMMAACPCDDVIPSAHWNGHDPSGSVRSDAALERRRDSHVDCVSSLHGNNGCHNGDSSHGFFKCPALQRSCDCPDGNGTGGCLGDSSLQLSHRGHDRGHSRESPPRQNSAGQSGGFFGISAPQGDRDGHDGGNCSGSQKHGSDGISEGRVAKETEASQYHDALRDTDLYGAQKSFDFNFITEARQGLHGPGANGPMISPRRSASSLGTHSFDPVSPAGEGSKKRTAFLANSVDRYATSGEKGLSGDVPSAGYAGFKASENRGWLVLPGYEGTHAVSANLDVMKEVSLNTEHKIGRASGHSHGQEGGRDALFEDHLGSGVDQEVRMNAETNEGNDSHITGTWSSAFSTDSRNSQKSRIQLAWLKARERVKVEHMCSTSPPGAMYMEFDTIAKNAPERLSPGNGRAHTQSMRDHAKPIRHTLSPSKTIHSASWGGLIEHPESKQSPEAHRNPWRSFDVSQVHAQDRVLYEKTGTSGMRKLKGSFKGGMESFDKEGSFERLDSVCSWFQHMMPRKRSADMVLT